MSTSILERCPFQREGTASRKIFLMLAKSAKPMTTDAVAQASRLPLGRVQTLLQAYRNPFHASPLVRAGVKLEKGKDGYFLKTAKPQPDAKRPPRSQKKTKKTAKKSPPKSAGKPKKKVSTPATAVAPAAVPDTTAALPGGAPDVLAN